MDTPTGILLILLAGVCVVVGGVLLLRLHAFLALILAAFVVALLTPHAALERSLLDRAAVDEVRESSGGLLLPEEEAQPDEPFVLLRSDPQTGRYRDVARLRASAQIDDGNRVLAPVEDAANVEYQPGDRLVSAGEVRDARKEAAEPIGARIAASFGKTAASIGILIAMAGIIGKCLLDSGAADKIVRTMLRWFGEAGAPLAFMLSGFLLGVPVFFDTVFYLMIPLGKAMRLRTGRNYLLYALTIVCGATMAHSLVPPTPGPLFVAEALNVDLGTMILAGTIVGLFSSTAGWMYATFANRRWDLPLRESEDFSLAEVEQSLQVDESELPSFAVAILPVLLPVVLIAGLTTLEKTAAWDRMGDPTQRLFENLGEKNFALGLSAVIAMATLIARKRQKLADLAVSIQRALASAGVIILITSAGGAFGAALNDTGVASLIEQLPRTSPAMVCALAFLVTTAIRTAQGSATVAMITAVGVLGGLAQSGELGFHPVYLALAIGCGSKPISWMNDSGFWVITRMSGMTEGEGLKYVAPMTAMMGVVGLLVVLVGVTVFPTW